MIDMVRGYVQLAGGLTQVTRQRALEVARQVVAGGPAGAMPVRPEELAARASALADELVTAGRQNRALLLDLVRSEVENVVARLGLTGREELESALATSRARIHELEHELAARDAELVSVQRAAAKKATAKKSTAKKSTAKKSTAKKSTAKKATAKKATAKKAPTQRTAAKKSTASSTTGSGR
ncbi:MAG: histone H1-like repetitive region-containing protein [Angustibacter sp.]